MNESMMMLVDGGSGVEWLDAIDRATMKADQLECISVLLAERDCPKEDRHAESGLSSLISEGVETIHELTALVKKLATANASA